MRRLSVIIPSKTARNFLICAEAVRRHEPEARLVLVNDGIADVEALLRPEWLMACASVRGREPFGCSTNVDIGMGYDSEDDILLLKDDALVLIAYGFQLLQKK